MCETSPDYTFENLKVDAQELLSNLKKQGYLAHIIPLSERVY